jgi:hypothetical protein
MILSFAGSLAAQVSEVGPGCGWLLDDDPLLNARKFSFHGFPRIGARISIWVYQPYEPTGYAERFIVVGERGSGAHGACGIYLDHLSPATAFWRYPTHDTSSYFEIPNNPALIGQEFIAQALVRVGSRVDLSRGLRIVIQP